jgi:hypothetical protein
LDLDELVKHDKANEDDKDAFQKAREFFDKMMANFNDTAKFFSDFDNQVDGILSKWKSHLDAVPTVLAGISANPDGSLSYPWHMDPEKMQALTNAAQGGAADFAQVDPRQPWIIEYEEAVVDYFNRIVQNGDIQFLCTYIAHLQDQQQDLVRKSSQVTDTQERKTHSMKLVEVRTQLSAFGKIENVEDVRKHCRENNPEWKKFSKS